MMGDIEINSDDQSIFFGVAKIKLVIWNTQKQSWTFPGLF